jgi:glutathione S-transferase
MIRRKVNKALWAQGISRHSHDEIHELARIDLNALSVFLGDRQWLLGDAPCGADAAVLAVLMSAYCTHFDTEYRRVAEGFLNLVAYEQRGRALFFPEHT